MTRKYKKRKTNHLIKRKRRTKKKRSVKRYTQKHMYGGEMKILEQADIDLLTSILDKYRVYNQFNFTGIRKVIIDINIDTSKIPLLIHILELSLYTNFFQKSYDKEIEHDKEIVKRVIKNLKIAERGIFGRLVNNVFGILKSSVNGMSNGISNIMNYSQNPTGSSGNETMINVHYGLANKDIIGLPEEYFEAKANDGKHGKHLELFINPKEWPDGINRANHHINLLANSDYMKDLHGKKYWDMITGKITSVKDDLVIKNTNITPQP